MEEIKGLYMPNPFWCAGNVAKSKAYAGSSSTRAIVCNAAFVVLLMEVAKAEVQWNGFIGSLTLTLWRISDAAWKGERCNTQ
eukprot:5637388-Ditylum_brightwellii.AAC.1